MSDSSMSSSKTSLSSSDSLDSFSNFGKLQQVTMNEESTDGEVSSSTMQTKEAEKERKGNLD